MTIQKGTKTFSKDDVILEEGTTSPELFYLQTGMAVAEVKDKVVGTIQEGEWFGEVAALLNTPRTATVRALRQCVVHVFRGLTDTAISDAMTRDPKLVRKLIETLALRLVETSKRTVSNVEGASGQLERYRKTISGTAYALEKICEKYKSSKMMAEVKDHLTGTSGIAMGDEKDVNMDFFPASKAIIQG